MALKVLAQPSNEAQKLDERGSGDGALRHLECNATAVAHDVRSNLHQLLANSANVRFWLFPLVTIFVPQSLLPDAEPDESPQWSV